MSYSRFDFTPVEPVDAQRALNLGVGVALSPIWAPVFAATGAGVAWWLATAWTRPILAERFQALTLAAPQATIDLADAMIEDAALALAEVGQTVEAAVTGSAQIAEETVEVAQTLAEEAAETTLETVDAVEAVVIEAEAVVVEPEVVAVEAETAIEAPKARKAKA